MNGLDVLLGLIGGALIGSIVVIICVLRGVK